MGFMKTQSGIKVIQTKNIIIYLRFYKEEGHGQDGEIEGYGDFFGEFNEEKKDNINDKEKKDGIKIISIKINLY